MRFIVALVVSFALVWACAKPLKKHPVPFYVCAVALVALYFWGVSAGVRGEAWSYFQPLMQRCALAFLLFTVVMFVGVLGEGNPLRTHLMPIRRQLSILACIFACGHIAFYGASYLPRLASAFSGNLAFSLGLAALITALMVVLWVTSAQRVKHAMKAASWSACSGSPIPSTCSPTCIWRCCSCPVLWPATRWPCFPSPCTRLSWAPMWSCACARPLPTVWPNQPPQPPTSTWKPPRRKRFRTSWAF